MLPPGEGGGFIWHIYSLSRFEESDGGVYVELEAIALSRDIPGALRWMVNPIVRRVSKNYMLNSLQQMKEAVRSTESPNQTVKPSAVGADSSKGAAASEVKIGNGFAARPETLSASLTPPVFHSMVKDGSEHALPRIHHLPFACHSTIPGDFCFHPIVSGLSLALCTRDWPRRGTIAADRARASNISSNNPVAWT